MRNQKEREIKSMYKRSKECLHLNANDLACVQCAFYDHAHSHCRAYSRNYDKEKMKALLENLKLGGERE